MKILVVDDNAQNLYLLQVLFSGTGYEAVTASNGVEALELLRKQRFDLIISDILMPEMDGFQLCREIKMDAGLRDVPLIYYTATYTSREDERFGRSLGAADFLTKPLPPEELLVRVRAVLDRADESGDCPGGAPAAGPPHDDELDYLKEYNVRLIKKLEHKLAQLEESEAKYRTLFEQSPDGVLILDPVSGHALECNHAICEMLELDRETLRARSLDGLLFDPEGPPLLALVRGEDAENVECALRSESGEAVFVSLSSRRIELKTERLLCVLLRDVTEQKKAAEALRQSEEQLRQAQKMEAIGRLASGIAHDFNNLLMVINGSCDLLLGRMSPDEYFRADIQHILTVGEQAAELTRQLLAFARKQRRHSRVIDLAETVGGLETMLGRVIGEDIDLTLNLPESPVPVMADPSQIELVILNLAVNARDAMPDGGKLSIEISGTASESPSADAAPEDFMQLTVADTGCGMDDATKSRIFEPFFTTKAAGRGTGLGLATVYGIVKQTGGYIAVDSGPGRGTRFRILLPRAGDSAAPAESPAVERVPHQGAETVLVVEDQDSVRSVIADMLKESGYTALEAANGREALKLAAEYDGEIHLLLTDVVLPGMNGRDVRNLLLETRPATKSLFMSGHIEDDVLWGKIGNQQSSFLPKPFTLVTLLDKVREVLDAPLERAPEVS